ncbi:MAG: hypothetical protein AAB639_00910 [Patescibacteria group bacterium]
MMRFGTESADKVLDDRYFRYHPMMGWLGDGAGFWIWGLLWLVTWVLVIAALAALVRWLWKKGDKVR